MISPSNPWWFEQKCLSLNLNKYLKQFYMNNNWLTIDQEGQRVILKKCSEEAEGKIIIPDGVTDIADDAFKQCKKITSVHIPDGVETIGNNAFWGCESLSYINFPEGLKQIGDNAFKGSKIYYHSISIPESVELGYLPFEYPDLDKIKINEAVIDFCMCHNLTSLAPSMEEVSGFIRELSEEIPDWKEQIKQTYFWHVFWYRCHRAVPVYTIFFFFLTGQFNNF